jgi:uncharacterized protein (TIGR03435 family)
MKTVPAFFTFLLVARVAFAQTVEAPLAFEVASIKPSAPLDMAAVRSGSAHVGTKIGAAGVDIGTASLLRLICTAYGVKPYQVSGPDWLKTTMYDIQAKIPDGMRADKIPEMLQTLLIERFGLKIRHESKDQPVYALVVANGGSKLKASVPDPAPAVAPAPPAEKAVADMVSMPTTQGDVKLTRKGDGVSIEMPGGEIRGKVRATLRGGAGAPPIFHLESSATTMKTFAEMLSVGVVDRPVVDITGLTGTYEVAVDLSVEDAMNVARASVSFLPIGGGGGGDARTTSGAAASDPSGASIFASIENLGLKLEPRKLPRDMLVVDRMTKTPTSN